MQRTLVLRWLLIAAVLVPVVALGQSRSLPSAGERMGGVPKITLRAGPVGPLSRIAAPIQASAGMQSATFQVTYSGFSSQAKAAFQAAVNIWASQISSPVPIKVKATWTPLPDGVLGAAGPFDIRRNFSGAPVPNTWYPSALADKLAGTDLDPGNPDIEAEFNSSFPDWYLGTDGNPPQGKYDFETTVLHELGHGLGFLSSTTVSGGNGRWGFADTNATVYPIIFDRFMENGSGQQLISAFANNSTQLAAQLQSRNVFFDGPKVVAATGGRAELYAPAGWQPGSSGSHLDESTYPKGSPNSLMTPFLDSNEVVHNPGSITRALFDDLGWSGATTIATATATQTPRPTAEPSLFLPAIMKYVVATATPTVTPTTPPAGKPKPGRWLSTSGEELYVSPDGTQVLNFSIRVQLPDTCGGGIAKITRTTPVSIIGNQFAFTGSFYASGAFGSTVAASGVDGLNNINLNGCVVSGGPWDWNATWQDSSQPARTPAGTGTALAVELAGSGAYRVTAGAR